MLKIAGISHWNRLLFINVPFRTEGVLHFQRTLSPFRRAPMRAGSKAFSLNVERAPKPYGLKRSTCCRRKRKNENSAL